MYHFFFVLIKIIATIGLYSSLACINLKLTFFGFFEDYLSALKWYHRSSLTRSWSWAQWYGVQSMVAIG